MLLQFNFSNYKSFRDEASLDLTASKITEYQDHIIEIGNEKVLPVTAIYGANASGKSNVFEAFKFMVAYIQHSVSYGGKTDTKDSKDPVVRPIPFLFDQFSRTKPSTFEVYFILPDDEDEKTYNYGFSLNKSGVTEEWLYSKAKTANISRNIFVRNSSGDITLKGIQSKYEKNINVSLNNETLALSLGSLLKVPIFERIVDWFSLVNFGDYGRPQNNLFLSRIIPPGFDTDMSIRKEVIEYLNSFDDSIVDFTIEPVLLEDGTSSESYMVFSHHRLPNSDELVPIPLSEESAGTLKMFALFTQLKEVMEAGGVYVIDELNSRLHPLLSRNFILTFLDPRKNKNHAQLIFTTHDTWLLESQILRRDEVWFTEKHRDGASVLYSLADFRDNLGLGIRKDESYEKNYLLGKYGAIPKLDNIFVMENQE